MSATLYWLQCGGCGGDTMALLSAETPNLSELLRYHEIELLWHPSFSNISSREHQQLLDALQQGEQPLDILCVEGAIIRGPGGTGMYDTTAGQPKKDLAARLARRAQFVVAVGTCACYGGIGTNGEVEATGLQFHKGERGGFLGADFASRAGLTVINLPGCPCHCDVLTSTLTTLVTDTPIPLDPLQTPTQWYGLQVHQGCIRNEYHEYRVEENEFGQRGCLFFHLGCHGPLAHGSCNKALWNRRSSKTRVGVPCFGCTRPDFPQPYPFFYTRNIADVPIELPEGVDRPHYLAYKGMAAAAAPKRLRRRETRL